ncbi:helix-turn-helix transcriptional regulator [Hydrogenophaga palleronii]|uniref:helix-turn-helix transcriptional regulator n=1 Tax=Hydrogenophaga palleronii TaxID=65655 RepID=UPI000825023C|nr:helix-turn-helix domain-containing protein [Hydrogenophaga palleronii]
MNLSNLPVDRALKKLGANIRQARLRRGQTRQEFAEHMGVSCITAQRLENGEPGVALYTMLRCLQALQLLDDFNRLLDPAQDTVGLVAQETYLPKRGRRAGLDMADPARCNCSSLLGTPGIREMRGWTSALARWAG